MALNQSSPTYRRSKWVSRADPFFNQVVIEESDHCKVLLEGRIRQGGSRPPFSLGGARSEISGVGTNLVADNGLELRASGPQKRKICIEIAAVGVTGLCRKRSCRLKLQALFV